MADLFHLRQGDDGRGMMFHKLIIRQNRPLPADADGWYRAIPGDTLLMAVSRRNAHLTLPTMYHRATLAEPYIPHPLTRAELEAVLANITDITEADKVFIRF